MASDMAQRIEALRPPPTDQTQPRPAANRHRAPRPHPGNHLILINGGSGDAGLVKAVADLLAARHGLCLFDPAVGPARARHLKPSESTAIYANS